MKTTAEIIAEIESGNNPLAYRYEGGWRLSRPELLDDYAKKFRLSIPSAKVLFMSSWGKYQIMGENLIAFGYDKTFFEFLFDEPAQDFYFRKFLVKKGIDFTSEEMRYNKLLINNFSLKYNGSVNAQYVNKIKNFLGS